MSLCLLGVRHVCFLFCFFFIPLSFYSEIPYQKIVLACLESSIIIFGLVSLSHTFYSKIPYQKCSHSLGVKYYIVFFLYSVSLSLAFYSGIAYKKFSIALLARITKNDVTLIFWGFCFFLSFLELCFISLLYLDLYVLGDDALII